MDYHDVQSEIKQIPKHGDHGAPSKSVGFDFTKHAWEEIPSGK